MATKHAKHQKNRGALRIGARKSKNMSTKKTSKSRRPAPIRSSKWVCGVELIAAERQRQISKEKWSEKHDDGHNQRELARAAHSYVGHYVHRAWVFTNELEMPGVRDGEKDYRNEEAPEYWPWDEKDWNPQEPLRDLVKAGALIAAEIDRLQRAKRKPHTGELSSGGQAK